MKREILWIEFERSCLWNDFSNASDRALKTPVPHDKNRWSIEMAGMADRIKEASVLLGGPTPWGEIGWSTWPYYEQIEGVPLPAEAWTWLEDYLARSGKDPMERIKWTLQLLGSRRTSSRIAPNSDRSTRTIAPRSNTLTECRSGKRLRLLAIIDTPLRQEATLTTSPYIERCACGAIGPWTASGVDPWTASGVDGPYRTPFIWRAILLGFLFGTLGVLVLMFAPITLTDSEGSCVSGGSALLGLIIGGPSMSEQRTVDEAQSPKFRDPVSRFWYPALDD